MDESQQTVDEQADSHSPSGPEGTRTDAREFARRAFLVVSELRNDPNPVSSKQREFSLEERVHVLEQQVDVLATALAKFASAL